MKNLMCLSTLFILASCASTLPPKEQRSLTFVEETKTKKDDSFVNALAFISKNFGNSNDVIKAQDKKSGLIVLKGNTTCNIFRQAGDVNDYRLQFTLELNFKDNKTRFQFEDLYISSNTGAPVQWDYNQLTDKSKVEKAGECLNSLKSGIVQLSSQTAWQ